MTAEKVLADLEKLAHPDVKKGMERYAISSAKALGVKIPLLRAYAKKTGKNHPLALQLWKTDVHEARIMAAYLADPALADEKLMEKWVKDFNSWDICDQCCTEVFRKTDMGFEKAVEWCKREEEFEKRAGFVMMAVLAVHDKKADDKAFIKLFPYLEKEAKDKRNFVKKAINWALRQIGKRNATLNKEAIKLAKKIQQQEYTSAKWIAADALRELSDAKILERMRKRNTKQHD